MRYAMLDKEGSWEYLQCQRCFQKDWYHESDPRVCKSCGRARTLKKAPPAKNSLEHEESMRKWGLW